MKKALILTTTGGFLQQFLMNDLEALRAAGFKVVYASNFKNNVYRMDPFELEQEGVRLVQVPIEKSPRHVIRNLRAMMKVLRLIDKEGIDLIHCHNPLGGIVGRIAAALSRRPVNVVYTAHGFHFFKGAPLYYWLLFYPAERVMARLSDAIITINSEDNVRARRFNMKRGGFVAKLHGVGLDTKRFSPRPQERMGIREKMGIPENAFHIVSAAELNDNKNQIAVIKAIERLPEKNIFFSICGRGETRAFLQDYIDTHGLSDRVRLFGYRYDMPEVLQGADCFAFTSKREGFGMAAVEALGTGVPVVAYDNRGTREYMRNGLNGIVVRQGDIAGLARAIGQLYEKPELRKKYGDAGRAGIGRFSKEQSRKVLDRVYARLK